MGGDGDELSFTTTCLLKPQPRQASVGGVTKSRPLEICQVTTGEAKGVHGGICDRAGEARARIGEDDGRLGRARDGIERFMLCFLSKFSQQTADSQGYSVPMSRSFQNRNVLELAKQECSLGPIGEEQHGFLLGIGHRRQDGVLA